MLRVLTIAFIIIAILHGLIHLMGFAAYWPLAKISELPYKTSLLNGRLELGAGGMRFFSLLWLAAALGFVAAALALAFGKSFWAPLMLGAVLLSLVLCLLDWQVAWRGALIDLFFLLVLGIVFGLRLQPAPFQAYSAPAAVLETVPLPVGLPDPVERFYRQSYGDQVPVYHSAVISGRGTLRFMGITFPARLRFTHQNGRDYRHYIEATFYGWPIMKVNEHYLDGHSRLALPFGVVENDPKVDSAANQGLWGEMSAYPAAFLTDPRLRWEPLEADSARLFIPFGDQEQEFTLTFDPQTGALNRMETLRYRDANTPLLRWWGEMAYTPGADGRPQPTRMTVTWEDEGTPWLIADIEETVFNTDVSEYIRQTGP